MILEWLLDVVLVVAVVPVVVVLLRGVLAAANGIVPSTAQIAAVAQAGSADLDATALLLTTREQAKQTIEAAADYGTSLDRIVDDAEVQ